MGREGMKMNYFILRQDRTVEKPVIPNNLDESLGGLYEVSSLFGEVEVSDDACYIDYLDGELPIVSDEMKQLLSRHEKALEFTAIVFTDSKKSTQKVYWFMEAPVIDCISKDTDYEASGVIKELVIRAKKVALDHIFMVEKGVDCYVLVNLDVAESILRRPFLGIELEKVRLDWM